MLELTTLLESTASAVFFRKCRSGRIRSLRSNTRRFYISNIAVMGFLHSLRLVASMTLAFSRISKKVYAVLLQHPFNILPYRGHLESDLLTNTATRSSFTHHRHNIYLDQSQTYHNGCSCDGLVEWYTMGSGARVC